MGEGDGLVVVRVPERCARLCCLGDWAIGCCGSDDGFFAGGMRDCATCIKVVLNSVLKLYRLHKKCGAGRPSMTNSLGWEMAVILVRVLCSLHNI